MQQQQAARTQKNSLFHSTAVHCTKNTEASWEEGCAELLESMNSSRWGFLRHEQAKRSYAKQSRVHQGPIRLCQAPRGHSATHGTVRREGRGGGISLEKQGEASARPAGRHLLHHVLGFPRRQDLTPPSTPIEQRSLTTHSQHGRRRGGGGRG